jgi:hypothetical protein
MVVSSHNDGSMGNSELKLTRISAKANYIQNPTHSIAEIGETPRVYDSIEFCCDVVPFCITIGSVR